MLGKVIIIFCCVFFASSILFAAHPLSTDDTGIVETGKYELEIGYDNCKSGDILRNHSCGVSLKHGITEKMDIGISLPYQVEPKVAENFGVATLGFKFLLIKDIFAFSINNELGSSEYFLNGIFSKEIQPITTHINLGYEATGDENARGEIIYSSAVEYPFEKIDLVGEIIGGKIGFENWLIGLRYKLGDVTAINCGYGNGFRNTDEKIALGFHTEF